MCAVAIIIHLLIFRVMAKYASQHFKQRLMSWVSLFLIGVFILVLAGIKLCPKLSLQEYQHVLNTTLCVS